MDTSSLVSEAQRFETINPVNAMSVDVEDYFQVSAFDTHVDRSDWASIESRLPETIDRLLTLFSEHNIHATFFTLGWVAKRFPELVRRMVSEGHEIASHGMSHVRVSNQSRDEFRSDATESRALLEDVSGSAVHGYRAASYSINEANLWALDVLQECGYRYSSSIYPIKHDHYGIPNAPRFAFRTKADGLLEIPVTTVEVMGRKFPCGGGGYFRLLPYSVTKWAMQRVNAEQQPCIFYFHPWEVDPDQPKIQGIDLKTRFRHYLNLKKVEPRLRQLLNDFRWTRLDSLFCAD